MRVVYVSHNEIGDGLVRSQVLSYLRLLREAGAEFRLITFERGGRFPEGEFPRDQWVGIKAAHGRGLLAKVADAARGTLAALAACIAFRADLIHARSYLPAAIGALVGFVTRRPYVFDMRGFLPEEYREVGLWEPRDLRYRVTVAAERVLLARAAGVIVPTSAAERRLRTAARYAPLLRATPITVLPSMVDLERFRPHEHRAEVPTLVYSGTLGSWYMLDEMLTVYGEARALLPGLRFLIVSRSDPRLVDEAKTRTRLEGTDVVVRAAEYREMPELLAAAHVAIVLVRQAPSKLAASALKLAEYLACGLPTIVNDGLGDAGTLVERYRAGHVVHDYGEPSLRLAARSVVDLSQDAEARTNARRLAEKEFDLREGARRYHDLYERVTARRMRR